MTSKRKEVDYHGLCEELKRLIDIYDKIGFIIPTEDKELVEAHAHMSRAVDSFMQILSKRFGLEYPPLVGQFYDSDDLKELLTVVQRKASEWRE